MKKILLPLIMFVIIISSCKNENPDNDVEEQEKLVFVSERDGNYEIYIMNADGSAQTRLTINNSSVK